MPWGLRPRDGGADWDRRLGEVVEAHGVGDRRFWADGLTAARQDAMAAVTLEARVFAVAWLAWWCRLGVAAGHVPAASARTTTAAAASALRGRCHDWLGYGDAFVAEAAVRGSQRQRMALRADTRLLYRPGWPWADVAWPPP